MVEYLDFTSEEEDYDQDEESEFEPNDFIKVDNQYQNKENIQIYQNEQLPHKHSIQPSQKRETLDLTEFFDMTFQRENMQSETQKARKHQTYDLTNPKAQEARGESLIKINSLLEKHGFGPVLSSHGIIAYLILFL